MISNLTISPSQLAVTTGASGTTPSNATGTVTLNQKATMGDVTVSLSSSNSCAVVPPSVTIPNGQQSATFPVTTGTVQANQSVTAVITASTISSTPSGSQSGANNSSMTAQVTVSDTVILPSISQLMITPGQLTVTGTMPVSTTGTVTLNQKATQDVTVSLSSSNTMWATVPPSVTIPKGQQSNYFTITTGKGLPLNQTVTVAITAATSATTATAGSSQTANLTITRTQ